MGWIKDFVIGLKDDTKADLKLVTALLTVLLVVAGIFVLFELTI
jgi:hypothetical protein